MYKPIERFAAFARFFKFDNAFTFIRALNATLSSFLRPQPSRFPPHFFFSMLSKIKREIALP